MILLVTLNSSAQVVAQLLDQPEQQRQLSAGRADADVSGELGDRTSGRCRSPLPPKRGIKCLMNVAKFGRTKVPMIVSQVNLRPVFDVHADIQGRDLASAANAIDAMIAKDRPDAASGITVTLSGQIETMRESFARPVRRHRPCGDPRVPAPGDQFPELARSARSCSAQSRSRSAASSGCCLRRARTSASRR